MTDGRGGPLEGPPSVGRVGCRTGPPSGSRPVLVIPERATPHPRQHDSRQHTAATAAIWAIPGFSPQNPMTCSCSAVRSASLQLDFRSDLFQGGLDLGGL